MSEEVFTTTTNQLKEKMKYRMANEAVTKSLAQIGDVMSVTWAEAVGPNAEKILAPLR
jgi:hypothetical protein